MKKTIIGLLLAIFAFLLLIIGPKAMTVWLLVATIFGLREYYEKHRAKGFQPLSWLGIPFGCSLIVLALLSIYVDGREFWPTAFATIVILTLLALLVCQFYFAARGLPAITTVDVSVTLFGALYVGGLLSFILLIWGLGVRIFPDDPLKINMCVFMPFWAAYGSDSSAYLVGSKFGKHKMLPRVSPNKSIEGGLGALFFCLVGTVLVGRALGYPLLILIALGIVAGVAAQVGDHCESVFKREHDVKDSGSAFGDTHGGFLDKMDSIVFTLPVFYYFLAWYQPPYATAM